jgi:hypothetical protein
MSFLKRLFTLYKRPKDNGIYTPYTQELIDTYQKNYPLLSYHIVEVPEMKGIGSESILEYSISEWFRNEGDYIEKGDIICSIESSHFTCEFETAISGTIFFKTNPTRTLRSGDTLFVILQISN